MRIPKTEICCLRSSEMGFDLTYMVWLVMATLGTQPWEWPCLVICEMFCIPFWEHDLWVMGSRPDNLHHPIPPPPSSSPTSTSLYSRPLEILWKQLHIWRSHNFKWDDCLTKHRASWTGCTRPELPSKNGTLLNLPCWKQLNTITSLMPWMRSDHVFYNAGVFQQKHYCMSLHTPTVPNAVWIANVSRPMGFLRAALITELSSRECGTFSFTRSRCFQSLNDVTQSGLPVCFP